MSAPVVTVEARAETLRRVLAAAAPSGAWEFSVWEEWPDAEPRILDTEAATRLGFKQPRDVRKLIERIWPETKRPHCRATVARQPVGPGGQGTREYTVSEYWLTEAELLKLCARARTETAELILDEMIAVFMAVRRHLAGAVPVVAHERKKPRALPAPRPKLPRVTLTAERAEVVARFAAATGASVEDLIDNLLFHWVTELSSQLDHPELRARRGAEPHVLLSTVNAGLWDAIKRKVRKMGMGDTPANRDFAAYALLEMGAHLQDAHYFASLGTRK